MYGRSLAYSRGESTRRSGETGSLPIRDALGSLKSPVDTHVGCKAGREHGDTGEGSSSGGHRRRARGETQAEVFQIVSVEDVIDAADHAKGFRHVVVAPQVADRKAAG